MIDDHDADVFQCERCVRAVVVSYWQLRDKGYDDASALLCALRLLNATHPGHAPRDYIAAIARWLRE